MLLSYTYALVSACLPALGLGAIARQPSAAELYARADKPNFPYDKNTTPYCSFWYDNDESMSCQDIISVFAIPMEKFVSWNPSITSGCGNFIASRSYCVEASGEVKPTTTTSSTTLSASLTSITPTTTRASNGIETPTPIQPDLISNCNKFYWVKQGENCETIASKSGIALKDFLTWNPKAGPQCAGLGANAYACVSIIGYQPPPTSTKPSNGVQTPLPTQSGMVDNCNKFRYVKTGDSCAGIASEAGISVLDFSKWNPQVGSQCTGLWASAYACIGILPAFRLKTRYHADCTGNVHNDVSIFGDTCVNTDCQVGSIEVAAEGYCPDGQVQISYWERPGCAGKWFGYGYASKGQCQALWTDGWKFKAVHLRCARKEADCISQGTCQKDAEPSQNVC